MTQSKHLRPVFYAFAAAALFGASTPFAKKVLPGIQPALLAGLLYLGSGLGLAVWWIFSGAFRSSPTDARLTKKDVPWLAGAIACGGIIAPLLLMLGLGSTSASAASLLLNLEGVFTALLAWFVFRENFDRRIALGMVFICLGAVALSWLGVPVGGTRWGALAISGACLAWAADNNLTRQVSAADPVQIAMFKGLTAGGVNTAASLAFGASLPDVKTLAIVGLIGLLGYGVSLVFFVVALRHLGTARTGAYFAMAPFVGAAISIGLLREPVTLGFGIGVILMGIGVWLHLTESHSHEHHHELIEHDHMHTHDEHHQHNHPAGQTNDEAHSHSHIHEPITHKHPHYPDIHHRHQH
jgi:drug/metabolite transporter (DMT)-like permease